MKYMRCPKLKEWQMYYEYIDTKSTYVKLGEKYGVTGARIRQLVGKVKKYLENGNTRIVTREQIQKLLSENIKILFFEKNDRQSWNGGLCKDFCTGKKIIYRGN